METKHTPGPWFALEYAGTFLINNGPYYHDKNILDFEDVGEYTANANAKIIEAAPDLLGALQDLLKAHLETLEVEYGDNPNRLDQLDIKQSIEAIKKATE